MSATADDNKQQIRSKNILWKLWERERGQEKRKNVFKIMLFGIKIYVL